MPEISANNYSAKKSEFNAGNHNLLKVITNENLIADIVVNEISDDDDFLHQHSSIILKSDSHRFGCLLQQEETTEYINSQLFLHKFPRLFILFHCWKYFILVIE